MMQWGKRNNRIHDQEKASEGDDEPGATEIWSQDVWSSYHNLATPCLVGCIRVSNCLVFIMIVSYLIAQHFLPPPKGAHDNFKVIYRREVYLFLGGFNLFFVVPMAIFTFYNALKAIYKCFIVHVRSVGLSEVWILSDLVIEGLLSLIFFIGLISKDVVSASSPILVGVSVVVISLYAFVTTRIHELYDRAAAEFNRPKTGLKTVKDCHSSIIEAINMLEVVMADADIAVNNEMIWANSKTNVGRKEAEKIAKFKEELSLFECHFSDISRSVAETHMVAISMV